MGAPAGCLLAAVVLTGLLGAAWPTGVPLWLSLAAGMIALVGLYLLVGGGVGLGRQLAPFPKPVSHGTLRTRFRMKVALS